MPRSTLPRRLSGFTLIELMVAIAVLVLLATIALPNFQSQVQRTRRADAKTALYGLAQQLERCYSRFGTYNHASCSVGTGPFESPDGHYRINLSAFSTDTFTLTAIPLGAQQRDTQCTRFVLNHLGQAMASGALGNECWAR